MPFVKRGVVEVTAVIDPLAGTSVAICPSCKKSATFRVSGGSVILKKSARKCPNCGLEFNA